MSMLENARRGAADPDLLSTIEAIARAGFRRFTAARRASRAARLLSQCSDRELKDIGLTRSDLWRLPTREGPPAD
jgi:uncharacterized protein YjiS (DUF1127 family)